MSKKFENVQNWPFYSSKHGAVSTGKITSNCRGICWGGWNLTLPPLYLFEWMGPRALKGYSVPRFSVKQTTFCLLNFLRILKPRTIQQTVFVLIYSTVYKI